MEERLHQFVAAQELDRGGQGGAINGQIPQEGAQLHNGEPLPGGVEQLQLVGQDPGHLLTGASTATAWRPGLGLLTDKGGSEHPPNLSEILHGSEKGAFLPAGPWKGPTVPGQRGRLGGAGTRGQPGAMVGGRGGGGGEGHQMVTW